MTRRCARKRRYASEEEAQQAGEAIPNPVRVYRCPSCDAYHLTSQPIMDVRNG